MFFVGYLIGKDGSRIGEVYSLGENNSGGGILQLFIILLMIAAALASAFSHFFEFLPQIVVMPVFYIIAIGMFLMNIFNARRILDSGGSYFSQSLNILASGSLIGGLLLSLAIKSFYLQKHNFNVSTLDGVGRYLGCVFIAFVLCLITLILGFIISAIIGFDSYSGASKFVFFIILVGFIIGCITTISSARNNANNDIDNYIKSYSDSQMAKLEALDMFAYEDKEEIDKILSETYSTLQKGVFKRYSEDYLLQFQKYESKKNQCHQYLTNSQNCSVSGEHGSITSTPDRITIKQGGAKCTITYFPKGKVKRIGGHIEAPYKYAPDSTYPELKPYFKVFADGKEVYKSGYLKYNKDKDFSADVKNASMVEIVFYTNLKKNDRTNDRVEYSIFYPYAEFVSD